MTSHLICVNIKLRWNSCVYPPILGILIWIYCCICYIL
nr:MAG TPA: hypothetical protein [Herelleviridae sp.]